MLPCVFYWGTNKQTDRKANTNKDRSIQNKKHIDKNKEVKEGGMKMKSSKQKNNTNTKTVPCKYTHTHTHTYTEEAYHENVLILTLF